jgi:hypothetical protein
MVSNLSKVFILWTSAEQVKALWDIASDADYHCVDKHTKLTERIGLRSYSLLELLRKTKAHEGN